MSRTRPLGSILLGLLAASRALAADGALTGTAELGAGGGYDSNPLLTVAPGADLTAAPVGGAFVRLAPTLGAGASLASGHRFELVGDADLRASDAFGRLLLGELELSYVTPRLGVARFRAAGHAGVFEVSSSAADSFRYAGGEVGARLELGAKLRVLFDAALEARGYYEDPAGAHTDVMHLASLRVPHRPTPWFEVGLDAAAAVAAPTAGALGDAAAFWRVRGGGFAQAVLGRWTATASAWGADVDASSSSSRGQLGGGIAVRWWAWPSLDLLASALVEQGLGADRRPIDDRRLVLAGLSLHLTGARPLRAAPAADEDTGSPAPFFRGGRVRFRVDADAASRVVVVGSWDDWAAPLALTRVAGTRRWEAWVAVPPGSHRYRFVVDGRAVRPEAAPRYQTDDFGGEDGVVDVPR